MWKQGLRREAEREGRQELPDLRDRRALMARPDRPVQPARQDPRVRGEQAR